MIQNNSDLCEVYVMSDKELRITFFALLHELDTETQTNGCRANNLDICANVYLWGICVFASHDCKYAM